MKYRPTDSNGSKLSGKFYGSISPVAWQRRDYTMPIDVIEAAHLLVGLTPPTVPLGCEPPAFSDWLASPQSRGLFMQCAWRKHEATDKAVGLVNAFIRQWTSENPGQESRLQTPAAWLNWADHHQRPVYPVARWFFSRGTRTCTPKTELQRSDNLALILEPLFERMYQQKLVVTTSTVMHALRATEPEEGLLELDADGRLYWYDTADTQKEITGKSISSRILRWKKRMKIPR